jgi:hypothetical protein
VVSSPFDSFLRNRVLVRDLAAKVCMASSACSMRASSSSRVEGMSVATGLLAGLGMVAATGGLLSISAEGAGRGCVQLEAMVATALSVRMANLLVATPGVLARSACMGRASLAVV